MMSSFADRKAVYTSRKWRNMRREIVKAAGNRCSQCGERHTSRLLELHHITPLEEAPELAFQNQQPNVGMPRAVTAASMDCLRG